MLPCGHQWLGKRRARPSYWAVPGHTREGLDQTRREEESADQQVVPTTYLCLRWHFCSTSPAQRIAERASKAKGIYFICHASKTQADNREDKMPDLHSLSEDKHMTASWRGSRLNCSHAFPWERGNCFDFFFLIFLLWLFLKYPASWRLGLKR